MSAAMGRKNKTAARAKVLPRKTSDKNGAKKLFGDFLFEIGCEEIPAGMIAKAAQELQALLAKYLSEGGLVAESSSKNSIE